MSDDIDQRAKSTNFLVGLFTAVLAALALSACGSSDSSTTAADAPDYTTAIKHAPPNLAALYADGDAVLSGGQDTYDGKLADVRGYPVVVNNWASWCLECREEFPYFQSQSAQHLDEVAFLGVDSEDSTEAANTYLRDNPVPYPSVEAPGKDFQDWTGTTLVGYPNTLFYDSAGKLIYTHQGVYADEAALAADIEKYALSS